MCSPASSDARQKLTVLFWWRIGAIFNAISCYAIHKLQFDVRNGCRKGHGIAAVGSEGEIEYKDFLKLVHISIFHSCVGAEGCWPTPNVVFRIFPRLSSFKYSNESTGMSTPFVPMLSHVHKTPNSRQVANNLGRELYHDLLFLAASKVAAPFGDINPKVSMEMRRMSLECSTAAKETVKKTWGI